MSKKSKHLKSKPLSKNEIKKHKQRQNFINGKKYNIRVRGHMVRMSLAEAKAINDRDSQYKNILKVAQQQRDMNWPSEVWFWKQYEAFAHKDDKKSVELMFYIPDISNQTYKYIIEIDGSVHNLPDVIKRDKKKDEFFKSQGYQVFRVKHNDYLGFRNLLNKLSEIREIDFSKLPNYNNVPRL